jgi:hypothetical protein
VASGGDDRQSADAPGDPAGSGQLPREMVVLLGLSGRGDKDLAALGAAHGRAVSGFEEAAR